jgi:hypothetical protein
MIAAQTQTKQHEQHRHDNYFQQLISPMYKLQMYERILRVLLDMVCACRHERRQEERSVR